MTTSGSYDFSMSRDDLILGAHQHIGAVGEGETCTTSQTTEAAKLLNMLVKWRAADGMPLWALKRGYLLPVTGVSSISTGSHIVSTYVQTTTSAAAISGASTITLTSVTGVANGYNIGVEQSNGTMLWTTVSGSPSGSTVTLATPLTYAVASGGTVYVYQTANRIARLLRIIEGNIFDPITGSRSYPINQMSRTQYFELGDRTAASVPNQFYVDVGLTSQDIYVYPRFYGGDQLIEFSYQAPFQDFDASTDTPDFPQEFYLPLMVELASLLGPKFGVPIEERKSLIQEANMYFNKALESTYPEGSLFLQPNKEMQ